MVKPNFVRFYFYVFIIEPIRFQKITLCQTIKYLYELLTQTYSFTRIVIFGRLYFLGLERRNECISYTITYILFFCIGHHVL